MRLPDGDVELLGEPRREGRNFGPAPHVKFEGQMRDVVLPGLFGERHSLGDLSNPE